MTSRQDRNDSAYIRKAKRLGYLSAAPRVATHPDAEMGGPRAHVLGVIQAFQSLGWDVHSYIVGDRMPHALMAESEQKLERSGLFRLAADLVRLIMGAWHSYKAWRELRGKVDWVYERFAVLQSLGWIFQRQKTPWILESNGLLYRESTVERKSIVLSGVARVMEISAYRRCDVLVCVTEALKNLIIEVAGISPNKVLVMPNGVDVDRYDPAQARPKRLYEGSTLGFIGGLFKWRGLDLPLAALADLRREGFPINFVVVGDGPMRKTWEAYTRELGLQECVRFVGRVPWNEASAYIAGFDIGYMGFSPVEADKMFGSPLKLYEYMAMALPVVSSACPDAWEMITPGQNGYIFEPGDREDLKRILRRAYQEKEHWHRIGLAARARVMEKASWRARVQRMIIGIERVLEEKSANPAPRR